MGCSASTPAVGSRRLTSADDGSEMFDSKILRIKELQKHGSPSIVIALVGNCNKADLHDSREVATELQAVFAKADQNKDGKVSADELAELIAMDDERDSLLKRCPVCGETLGSADELNDMKHIMTLCFDEGTGTQIMTRGFLNRKAGLLWEAKGYAHANGMLFIESSAKTTDNVNQLFEVRDEGFNRWCLTMRA